MNNIGIESIYKIIEAYLKLTKTNGYFQKKRNSQSKQWFFETIDSELKNKFYKNEKVQELLDIYLDKIERQKMNPYKAAQELLKIKQ